MSRKLLGGSVIYIILGLVFIAVVGLRTISTPEIWTHLAQGENNAPISFLESDSAINTTHLYDKLAHGIWNMGGAPLLIILNIFGLLIAFSLLIQVSKKWGGPLSQGFALLITGHLIFQSLDVGPHVVMMLFIALFLYILNNFKSSSILFGALIPLQILWTNMHGSFLFGPIIVALTAIQISMDEQGATKRRKTQTIQPSLFWILAGTLLVSTLLNPYFLKLHGQILTNLQSPAPTYWSSLFVEYFQIPTMKPLILFTMTLGAAGLITLKKKLPIVLTTLAMFGAFLVWTSPRAAMLFSVLAFPFMVLSITAVSNQISSSLKSLQNKQTQLLAPAIFVVLIILSCIPIVNNCAYAKSGMASNFGLGAQEELFPNGAAEAIITHPDFPERAINLASDGGYLAFKYNRSCFIDYRPGRYDTELLKDLNSMMLGNREAYDSILEAYRPEAIIINTLSPYSAQAIHTLLMRPIWKLAYFDGTTAILLQNKEEFAAILNDSQAQTDGLAQLEKARAKYATQAGQCSAGNPAELIGSGKIFLALNRPEESKAIFTLLLQGNSKIPGAWIGLGNSQLMTKEFDAAVQSLETATQMAPNNQMAWASYAIACNYAGNSEEAKKAMERALQLAEQNKAAAEKKKESPKNIEDEATTNASIENMILPEM